ncbi:hypothetical protein CPB97_000072 [Podila verticillata]|nr:hypothetical protein CPB97_000072 [Podila verticillata]
MLFKLSSISSLVVVFAVVTASTDAYQLWYKNKGSDHIHKKNIAGNTCVHLTTVSKKIAEVVPNTDARTGCKTYSDLKCEHKGFSRKGSVYCTEE